MTAMNTDEVSMDEVLSRLMDAATRRVEAIEQEERKRARERVIAAQEQAKSALKSSLESEVRQSVWLSIDDAHRVFAPFFDAIRYAYLDYHVTTAPDESGELRLSDIPNQPLWAHAYAFLPGKLWTAISTISTPSGARWRMAISWWHNSGPAVFPLIYPDGNGVDSPRPWTHILADIATLTPLADQYGMVPRHPEMFPMLHGEVEGS